MSQTQLRDFTLTFHFHALEKEMATHSNILAWRIPGTGEHGGLPYMGLHRVRHDWSDAAAADERKNTSDQNNWASPIWLELVSNARCDFVYPAVISGYNWNVILYLQNITQFKYVWRKPIKRWIIHQENRKSLSSYYSSFLTNCHTKLNHSSKTWNQALLCNFQTLPQMNRHSNVSWSLANLQCLHYFTIIYFLFKRYFIASLQFSTCISLPIIKSCNVRRKVSAEAQVLRVPVFSEHNKPHWSQLCVGKILWKITFCICLNIIHNGNSFL